MADIDLQVKGIPALREQVSLVARLRGSRAAANAALGQLQQEFNQANYAAITMAELANEDLAEAEAELRAMTLAAFKETGLKHPVNGVDVQMRTRLEYRPDAALEWAISQNRAALLTLKRTDFERTARALADAGPPDALWFVQRVQEPTATIATDLSTFATEPPPETDESKEIPF